jgi:hypothetical protein
MQSTTPTAFANAAAWTGREMSKSEDWIYRLNDAEIAASLRAAEAVRSLKATATSLDRDAVELGALGEAARRWRDVLHRGRGFVLVRGLPVDGMSETEAAALYWLLGQQLGSPVPQNFAGEVLTDIRDTGADPDDPSTRLYKTKAEQDFHTDGADIIGLLCLKTSKSGGQSRIVSSVTVYNEVLRRRPEVAPLLFENFYWHYFEPQMPAPVHFARPICAVRGSSLNTAFIPWYIRRAQELADVPPMTPEQQAAIETMEQTANDPSLYLDMDFQPGDIQWLKNAVILHKRTAYEDWGEPEKKRHLLRLWLAAPDFEDGDEQLRRGITIEAAR